MANLLAKEVIQASGMRFTNSLVAEPASLFSFAIAGLNNSGYAWLALLTNSGGLGPFEPFSDQYMAP